MSDDIDNAAKRDDLFQLKNFTMHSGAKGTYKLECDSFTDGDLETLAHIVAERARAIRSLTSEIGGTGINRVHGIPRGGVRFANALQQYAGDPEGIDMIVDDVHTTGASMEEAKLKIGWANAIGVVIFSRGSTPADWIKPIFSMTIFK